MRSDVHTAALRAAAKVAFSVAFLGGCSAASPAAEDADPTANDDGVEPGITESDLSGKTATKKKPRVVTPASTSCRQNDSGAPKPSCENVVAAAFPTDSDYPGTKQSVAKDVQTCCAELLTASQGSLAKHRWDCCANVAPGVDVAQACTPWGPPVPPAMRSAKRHAKLNEVA